MDEVVKNQLITLVDTVLCYNEERTKVIGNIGNVLKNERLKLNFTREYVSQETKVPEDDIYYLEKVHIALYKSDKENIHKLINFYSDTNHEKHENKNVCNEPLISDKIPAKKTRKTKEINEENLYTAKGFAKKKQLSNIIKFHRKKLKISQKELSQQLMWKSKEFNKNTIHQCERTIVHCTLIRRYWIAIELDIDFKKISINQKELTQLINLKDSFSMQEDRSEARQIKNERGAGRKPYSDFEIVKQIYDYYINGYSTNKIADILNSDSGLINSKPWSKSNIRIILLNPFYIGKCIDKTTFDRVKELMKSKPKGRGKLINL